MSRTSGSSPTWSAWPPEDMRVGIEVEVFFEDWTAVSGAEDSRVWIPLFRPVR